MQTILRSCILSDYNWIFVLNFDERTSTWDTKATTLSDSTDLFKTNDFLELRLDDLARSLAFYKQVCSAVPTPTKV